MWIWLVRKGPGVDRGEIPTDPQLAAGSYYLPTIIDGLSNQARVCQEEIFGPVLVVMPFDDESQLVAEANDSVYGLAAGIWSRDFVVRCNWRQSSKPVRFGSIPIKVSLFPHRSAVAKRAAWGERRGLTALSRICSKRASIWRLITAVIHGVTEPLHRGSLFQYRFNKKADNERKITVGEAIARTLEQYGVTAIYGIISIHNLPVADAIGQRERIRFIPARGEAGAVTMADAHGRFSGLGWR